LLAVISVWANCDRKSAQNAFWQGDYKKALVYYDACVADNPKSSEAYLARANTYRELNDSARAFADFDKAIALGASSDIYAARAYTHKYFGDYQKAIDDYSKALELLPSWGDIYYERAIIKAKLGDDNAAIADLTQAINVMPNHNARSFYARGYISAIRGDHRQAIADFTRTIAVDASLREARECLALSYEVTGDLESAKKVRDGDIDHRPCAAPR
jgi:tetratricopeptide (TPR) repeat protein